MAGQSNPATEKAKTVKVLRVVSKRDGFRRAGFEFGSEARDIPLANLKKQQIEQLTSDPMLVCVEAEVAAPKEEAE